MKEIPILFSTPMVQALLAGRKTMTRRIVKAEHVLYNLNVNNFIPEYYHNDKEGWCPYGQPGDLLWVRETWGIGSRPDPFVGCVDGFEYKADQAMVDEIESLPIYPCDGFDFGNYNKKGWRPSIHMPKVAARIWLQKTTSKVERACDISREDAIAEGLACITKDGGRTWKYGMPDRDGLPGTDDNGWAWQEWEVDPVAAFKKLWCKINGPETWGSWVWVESFNVLSTTGKPSTITAAEVNGRLNS